MDGYNDSSKTSSLEKVSQRNITTAYSTKRAQRREMDLLASHGGYLVSDLAEHCSLNPLQFYPAEMPGGKDNYSDDNGINAIRHLTLVFLGHMHRVELIAKFETGKFFFFFFPANTLTPSYLHFFCIPEKDPFLEKMWFHPLKIISSPSVRALGTQLCSSLLSASLTAP